MLLVADYVNKTSTLLVGYDAELNREYE